MKLLFLRLVGDEESVLGKKTRGRSLAPLSKEAGEQQRQKIRELKTAAQKGKDGKVRVK